MAILTRDRDFYRTLIKLAIPMSLQNMISFAVNFADNLMIGSLGDYAVSGVYMGNQIQTVVQLFTGGINAAMLIIAAQYWGIKDRGSVRKIAAMSFRMAAYVGLAISVLALLFPTFWLGLLADDPMVVETGAEYLKYIALSYVFFCGSQILVSAMRAVENAKLGFYLSLVTLVTNISLNWILIFGHFGFPALGVKGAAIATLISRIMEAAVVFYYVFKVDKNLLMKPRDLLGSEPTLRKDFFKNGLPVIAGDLVWSVNMLAYSAIMGHMSAEAVTASSIAGMMNNLMTLWVFGLSGAVSIITGKTVGAGQFEKMKEYAKTVQVLFFFCGIFAGLMVFLLRNPFLSLYNVSDEAMVLGRQFMTVLAVTIFGTCWQATCLGGLVKAGGDTSFVFKNDTIFVFLVVIPAGYLAMKFGLPAWMVFAGLKCDQILKCFVAIFKINSFNWMKKLTREDLAEAEG